MIYNIQPINWEIVKDKNYSNVIIKHISAFIYLLDFLIINSCILLKIENKWL